MTEYTGEMLAEVWTAMKPYIDKKERVDAAVAFLRAAENFTDLEECRKDLGGVDSSMDTALDELLGEEELYSDESGDGDDEDY